MTNLRISLAGEPPRLGAGRHGSQIERMMLAHQFALHLCWRTDGAGFPLERGQAAGGLGQQLRGAVACKVFAGEEDGRLALRRSWN